jgi:hypothetical protein
MLLDGKLYLAPIGANPQNVLDLGTGTGIWAMYAYDSPSFLYETMSKYLCKLTFS